MKHIPILFKSEMVLAILDGRKTMTRRVVKFNEAGRVQRFGKQWHIDDPNALQACPYGQPGDRLWVRETWRAEELDGWGEDGIRYRADNHFQQIENTWEAAEKWGGAYRPELKWQPSIFMPRWASRITLEVVSVRVERLQDITHNDACVEGAPSEPKYNDYGTGSIYKDWFAALWDSINAGRGLGWDVNPWVWVVEFQKVGE
jgi:hypothetical protein